MPNEKEDLEAKDRYIDSLEAELKEKRSALAAAESKHAEEMRSVEAENPILHEGVESVAERAKWTFAMQASEIRRLTARLSSLESRHAEEMREAIDLIRHVNEYWNGLDNPRALGDALTHIVEATDSFLSRHDKQSHSGTENVPSGDRKEEGK